MRSREEADSSGLLAALWNGVDSTNDEPSAKRDRLLRFLAVAKAKFPREIDLLGRIKSDANSNDARIRNVWSKNISILIDCISDLSEDERPERLSWTWIPDDRDVGIGLFFWYKCQLGYTSEGWRYDSLPEDKKNEIESLGIRLDAESVKAGMKRDKEMKDERVKAAAAAKAKKRRDERRARKAAKAARTS